MSVQQLRNFQLLREHKHALAACAHGAYMQQVARTLQITVTVG